ncbi:uncharacterized protein LOC110029831 [Phalaenopsis equestris]|uniref:uncharacterized protein LOC110029831 n=1 Tax=Phalaenopsis equestris TaxID=78828 RepID=UPI0009E2FD56|nr:uncharacterized protein LOC110029831 [Phalaenopsis equestris]
MAIQIRRLISTNCFHREFHNCSIIAPAMLQFKTVPNFPCSCISYTPNGFIKKSGMEMQIRTANCLQAVCSNRCSYSFCLSKDWRDGLSCSVRQAYCFNSILAGGNSYKTSFPAHGFLSKSSFSSIENKLKPSAKADGVGKDVINGDRKSKPQILLAKKRRKKASSVLDENDTEVITQPVARSEEAVSSEREVLKDGENKKGLSKSRAKIIGGKASPREVKNSNNKKHEETSEPCSSSTSVETKKLKKASRVKKTRVAGAITQNKSTNTFNEGVQTMNQQLGPLYPPSGKSVVVVESMTKAKVIQGYLGEKYEVLASYGHVRDLARRSGSVRPDDNFSLVWEVPSSAWTHLKSIKIALSSAENLILASDPDREGEAIAWHIIEMLRLQDALNENITVSRVVFHEITESSIKSALQTPREIDSNLVNAYLARRALDYLIGFSISPLLWRKLPGCQSAGRVQSAALALICNRETEIEQFKPQEYWTIGAKFSGSCSDNLGRSAISSNLTHFNSKRLDQLSIISKTEAEAIQKKINTSKFEVLGFKRSEVHRNPPMPYITSTLQQDSANKLHFTAVHTMKLAQQLYEGIKLSDKEATGLITYMRTDGMHISNEAAVDINSFVGERYGGKFASKGIRKYFKKVKNAQEAHEAIRPTDIRRLPSSLAGILDGDSLKLYSLIWCRTMACQMEPASIDMIQVDVGNKAGDVILRSAGSRTGFLGFEAVYKDKDAGLVSHYKEDDSDEAAFLALQELKVKDSLSLVKVDLSQHYTKPPSRYSEGALVKKLEELGIGRPSTYASIMKVLQDRSYMTMKNRVLHPEFRGRMVSEFLSHHFSEVTNYSFTADMETELDNVSAGTTEWKGLLRDYWTRFIEYCNLASNAHIHQVEKMLEEKFGHILFASIPNDSRLCPSCEEGTLRFKVSRFGSGYFIGCDQHPRCKFIAGALFNDDEENIDTEKPESFPPKLLGHSPISNEKIYLKNGPYGHYVQRGEDRTGCSPKRSSVTEGTDINSITLEDAIDLLQYPINLGNHPDDGHPIFLKHSRIGFSIKHRRTVSQVPKSMKPKSITLAAAVKLLNSKNAKQCGRPKGKPKSEELEEAEALFG